MDHSLQRQVGVWLVERSPEGTVSKSSALVGFAAVVTMFLACSSDDSSGPTPKPETPVLAITSFDVAEAGWGDAPVAVHFTWKIDSNSTKPLSCKIDFDGDGTFDEEIKDCKKDTIAQAASNLPAHTYDVPGRHVPKLVVSDGKQTVEATQKIYANKIEFAKHVVFPEKLPGFVKAEATPNTQVVLTFATAAQVPDIASGALVWGTSSAGYLIKATGATKAGTTVTVDGVQGKITEGMQGHLGARDLVSKYDDVRCVEGDCAGGTFEKLPPGGPGIEASQSGQSQQALTIQGNGSWGFKWNLPGIDGKFEHSLFAGNVIKDFYWHSEWFTLKEFNIEFTPSFQYDWAVKGELSKKVLLGTIAMGTIPIGPIVIAPMLFPTLTLTVNLKVGASTQIGLPLGVSYSESAGWQAKFKPFVHPALKDYVNPLETAGVSLGADVKFSPYVNFLILGAVGPYTGPNVGVGVEAKFTKTPADDFEPCKQAVQACLTAKISAGGEYGVDCPWVDDAKVGLDFTIAEWEFYKACTGKPNDAGVCSNPPDASVPDASVPDTSVPDTSVPDTSVPDTSVPDTGNEEICDGIDNDGNSKIDEGCPAGFNHLDLSGISPKFGHDQQQVSSNAFNTLCAFPMATISICAAESGGKFLALQGQCGGLSVVTDKTVIPYKYSVGVTPSLGTVCFGLPPGTKHDFQCPAGEVIHRVLGAAGTLATDRVGQLQFECVKLGFKRSAGNVWSVFKESTTMSPVLGTGAGTPFDWTPPDTAAGIPSFIRTFKGFVIQGNQGIYQLQAEGRSFKNLITL